MFEEIFFTYLMLYLRYEFRPTEQINTITYGYA